MDRLSEENQILSDMGNENKQLSNMSFNIIKIPNKSLILIQAKRNLEFGNLDLNPKWNYYRNDKKLRNDSLIFEGDNWINYRGKLLGALNSRKL